MTLELRNYGDGQTVVVYTNENAMAGKLRERKSCFKMVAYEQEQLSKKRLQLVGWDFYFPKSQMKRLLRLKGVELEKN